MSFTFLIVGLGLVVLATMMAATGFGFNNSVRPIARLVIDSIRTEPGWHLKTDALPADSEESYNPYWYNKSHDLSVELFEHVIVRGVPNSAAPIMLEMNEQEIEEFEEAVLDREERLLKNRRAG